MSGRTTIARTWFEQAQADLRAAEDSATSGQGRCAMSAVCSLDPRARDITLGELKRLADALRHDLGVEAVYAFGSFARGEEHEGSDIDLLVIGDLPGRVFDRVGEVLRRTNLPVEPIVMTRETFERRCRERHPLFTRIQAEGVRIG